jgi:hypothetical protein
VARVVEAPGWLVSARRRPGIAIALNHGTDHATPGATSADSPLYARLGYSTATLPPLTGEPLDNAVVLLDAAGRASHRTGFTTLFTRALPGGVLTAASSGPVRWVDTSADDASDHGSGRTGPVTRGPVVTVASVLRAGVEVRVARVDGQPERRWGPLRLGGWPVAPVTQASADPTAPLGTARADDLRSLVRGLRGFGTAGVTRTGLGPLGETAVPWLATIGDVVPGVLHVALVTLDRAGPDPSAPTVTVDGDRVAVTWPDGLHTEIDL